MTVPTEAARWATLFSEVPRAPFVPDDIWVRDDGGRLVPVSRRVDPERWAAAVAADRYLVTQVDEGQEPVDDGPRTPTSSSSMPSVVLRMLDELRVEPGHSALEIGTGTGWNAALLCHRVGDTGRVVTIEVDPALAEQATVALHQTGYRPHVVTGDGLPGFPEFAPYDRVIATASFREVVPPAWVEQLRSGGRLVGPWTSDWAGALLVLEPNASGATGRFVDHLSFMRIRSQRVSTYGWEPPEDEIAALPSRPTGCSGDDGDRMFNPDLGRFAIGARVPDCFLYIDFDARGERHHVVDLDDGFTRSFARLDWNVGSGQPYTVRQIGPRNLWDEVQAAYDWWHEQDEPGMDRFGLEVRDEKQWIWLDEPDHVVRVVAAPGTRS